MDGPSLASPGTAASPRWMKTPCTAPPSPISAATFASPPAAHGSGMLSLSHFVYEVRLTAYEADGKARIHIWGDGPELRAARCAVGCTGVILSVRFRAVPKYDVVETIVHCVTLDEVLAGE